MADFIPYGTDERLDNLADSKDQVVRAELVRKVVKAYLEVNKYKDIKEWAKDNPDKNHRKEDKSRGEEK